MQEMRTILGEAMTVAKTTVVRKKQGSNLDCSNLGSSDSAAISEHFEDNLHMTGCRWSACGKHQRSFRAIRMGACHVGLVATPSKN